MHEKVKATDANDVAESPDAKELSKFMAQTKEPFHHVLSVAVAATFPVICGRLLA